ncbi:sulfate transporter-like [Paramacrobiotus metropolitanus]|uniref:sulfate transporter-like n=1 Tax=Paramacrobiotus metropolitanus TaxID=2943436 RepID=UPI0024462E50|nr:sulfate transporter-like [Paramacrobiotus metropolitanus]
MFCSRFDTVYGVCEPAPLTPWQDFKRQCRKFFYRTVEGNAITKKSLYRTLTNWIPVIDWLPKYEWRSSLLPDVIAGITIGFLNTPQGVAYAMATKTPPVTGLYVSFFPLLVYFMMATSRHLSLGTDAVTSVMASKIVHDHALFAEDANGNVTHPEFKELPYNGSVYTIAEWSQIEIASAAGFLCGIWQLIFGLIGAGGLVVYFSDQLVQGFTCGAAFHVFTSQLGSVFGVTGLHDHYGAFKLINIYANFFQVIRSTHVTTFVVGLISVIFLIVVKFFINGNRKIMSVIKVPIPAELFVVIFGTLASHLMNMEKDYGVKIIKKIPIGFPSPQLPHFSKMSEMIGDTFAIAVVSLSISITLGLLFASKHGYSIDPDQEFKAMGVAKIFGSFFQCFPSSASVARTAVQNDVGGKTQIVSLVQCTIVLAVIVYFGKFLEPLPKACLGAIVMVSVLKLMFQIGELITLWSLSWIDMFIFLLVFLGVIILDVDLGLAVGIGCAIATVMLRLQKPKVGPIGRIPGTDIYRRTDVYSTAVEVLGIKIVRVDAPIYFANASYIKRRVYAWADLYNLIKKYKGTKAYEKKQETEPEQKHNFAFTNNISVNDGDGDSMERRMRTRKLSRESAGARSITSSIRRLSLLAGGRRRSAHTNIDMEILNKVRHTYESHADEIDADTLTMAETVPTKHLIIDCSEVCFVDVTGVGFLKKCSMECSAIDVELLLACTNKPVRDMLVLCKADEYIKPHQLFVTLHDAVLYALNVQRRAGSNSAAMNIHNKLMHVTTDEAAPPSRKVSVAYEAAPPSRKTSTTAYEYVNRGFQRHGSINSYASSRK